MLAAVFSFIWASWLASPMSTVRRLPLSFSRSTFCCCSAAEGAAGPTGTWTGWGWVPWNPWSTSQVILAAVPLADKMMVSSLQQTKIRVRQDLHLVVITVIKIQVRQDLHLVVITVTKIQVVVNRIYTGRHHCDQNTGWGETGSTPGSHRWDKNTGCGETWFTHGRWLHHFDKNAGETGFTPGRHRSDKKYGLRWDRIYTWQMVSSLSHIKKMWVVVRWDVRTAVPSLWHAKYRLWGDWIDMLQNILWANIIWMVI